MLPSSQAAPVPLVVVAHDVTASSSCQLYWVTAEGTPAQHTTYSPCPAGTVISTATISQTMAQQQHEAFVSLPSRNADAKTLNVVRHQIALLMDNARSGAYQTRFAQRSIQPLIACNTSATHGARASLTWDGSTHIDGSINYYKDPSCQSVTLNTAYAQRYDGYANAYWGDSRYAGHIWGFNCPWSGPCPYITFGQGSQGIHLTYPQGSWFQETYCSGANCTPFDAITTYNFTILN